MWGDSVEKRIVAGDGRLMKKGKVWERRYKLWENEGHTVTILKHLLWPNQVYWCKKCKKHVPARRTPGEIFALRRAVRKFGGSFNAKERAEMEAEIGLPRREKGKGK